jgi:hypothetical protein
MRAGIDATDRLGRDAGLLAATELGLGSLLHALQIPLAGHLLSLNQIAILTRHTRGTRAEPGARGGPAALSAIAAVLKSLSPAGKKLTPMLAISAQGLLFNLGTLALGRNALGAMLGALLSSAWAFVQPVLLYWLLFGDVLLRGAEVLYRRTQEAFHFDRGDLIVVVSALAAIKAVAALGVSWTAWRMGEQGFERYQAKLKGAGAAGRARMLAATSGAFSSREAALAAARDLVRPGFVLSLVAVSVFFVWSEASVSEWIWGLLRPVALGFVLYFAVRVIPWDHALIRLERAGWTGMSRSFRAAIRALRKDSEP